MSKIFLVILNCVIWNSLLLCEKTLQLFQFLRMRNPRIFLYKGVINNFGKVNLIKSFNLMSAHNLCSAVCNAGWSLGFSSIWIILPDLYLSCSIFLAGLDFWLLEEQWSFITIDYRAPVFSLWTYGTLVLVNSFSLFVWSSLMYRGHYIFNHGFSKCISVTIILHFAKIWYFDHLFGAPPVWNENWGEEAKYKEYKWKAIVKFWFLVIMMFHRYLCLHWKKDSSLKIHAMQTVNVSNMIEWRTNVVEESLQLSVF